MKRQIQKAGVRRWYGDDFLEMQDEIYKAIEDGILSEVGDVVLGGCHWAPSLSGDFSISPGVMLIGGKICFYEGISDTPLPAYFTKEELETDDAIYTDGNQKPTEKWYRAKRFDTPQAGSQVVITTGGGQRLKLPYTSEDGSLLGLPISDQTNLDSSKLLATAKAVNDARLAAIAASTSKYTKENFDSGEIDQNLIPVGQLWLGKDGKLRVSSTTLDFLGEINAQGDINSENDMNAVDINAANNLNADQDAIAGRNVVYDGKAIGKNTPKIIAEVSADGTLVRSLGSETVTDSIRLSTGIYVLNGSNFSEGAYFATNSIGAYSLNARFGTSIAIKVESRNPNGDLEDVAAGFSVLGFY